MRNMFKDLVIDILSHFSRRTLKQYKPIVISVTGNIGKTTTKDYIFNFLRYKYRKGDTVLVRASQKSENSEIGVNLTILGEKNPWNSFLGWLRLIGRNIFRGFAKELFPKVLVLEVGADKPGDIRYITSIVKSDVVVLTAFQKSPSHGEYFLNIDQHINEKKVLVDKMKKDGVIVYNADDEVMAKIAVEKNERSPKVKIFSYGYNENANIQILENTFLYSESADLLGMKIRLGLRFDNFSDEIELRLYDVVGEAHAYSVSAAVCVALLNEFKKEDLQNALKNYERDFVLPKSRMRILQGVNNSKIIDDSYNSSPKALKNAVETVSKIITKGKKIAILGHMAELGDKTKQTHLVAGLLASKVFDAIIFSGKYNEYYLEGARESKMDLSKVYMAENSDEVMKILEENNLIKEHDLILVKGSQSARLEKVVVELLVNPRDRSEVCRQDKEWLVR